MKRILGIDYGRKKIGLALNDGTISSPLLVLDFKNLNSVFEVIGKVIEEEKVEEAVIGLPEGRIRQEVLAFGKMIKKKLKIPVFFQDESLTTYLAKKLSLAGRIRRKKRKEMEHAYSACLILDAYLEKGL